MDCENKVEDILEQFRKLEKEYKLRINWIEYNGDSIPIDPKISDIILLKDEIRSFEDVAIEIRELLFDYASDSMQGCMVGSPLYCFTFASEWIKKIKGLDYCKEMFNQDV